MRGGLLGTRDVGRSHAHATARGSDTQPKAGGLSWLTESQIWPADSSVPKGGLSIDPVTLQRLLNYLRTHSHTGMGHATPALTRDVDGLNALAREAAYAQSADEVIGPRHAKYPDAMEVV